MLNKKKKIKSKNIFYIFQNWLFSCTKVKKASQNQDPDLQSGTGIGNHNIARRKLNILDPDQNESTRKQRLHPLKLDDVTHLVDLLRGRDFSINILPRLGVVLSILLENTHFQ